jgi:hypothetical protein
MSAGRFGEACPKLEESQRLDAKGVTATQLAECYEKSGKTASAWVRYQEARDIASRKGMTDAAADLTRRAQALEKQLSKLVVIVPKEIASLPGLQVQRDGVELGRGAWGAPLPVDPGLHVLEARAAGKKPWSASVQVGAGAVATAQIAALLDDSKEEAAPLAKPAVDARPRAERADRPEEASSSGQKVAGFAIGGAGLLGVVIGGVFFAKALGKQQDKNDAVNAGHCKPSCDDFERGIESDRNTALLTGTIVSVIGVAMTVGGVVLLATTPSNKGSAGSIRLNIGMTGSALSGGVAGSF